MKKRTVQNLLYFSFMLLFVACGKDPNEPGMLMPRTVDDDFSVPAIEVNGTRLHLQTFGNPEKPVMIFLHGGPGTGDFRAFSRLTQRYDGYALTDDYFLVMYDQRGAGLSRRYGNMSQANQHSIPEITLANYLGDLEEIVDHFASGEKVVLFGHSWGGMHAIMYTNKHPERVAGIILSEPGSFNADIENNLDLSVASTNLFGEETNDFFWSHQNVSPNNHQMLDYMYVNGFYNGMGLKEYHFDSKDLLPVFRFGTVASVNDLGSDGMTSDGTYTFDFTTNLSAFTTKVLFINGSLNEILTPEFQEKNRAFLPSSELKIIEGVGHDLIWTAPREHVLWTRDYLKEVLQ